jgi:hypothetical protein
MKAIALSLTLAACLFPQASYNDILAGPGKNWLTYGGDYGSRRHSPLSQVNAANVANLVPVWTYHVDGALRLEATPLVVDGILYVTNSNELHALDARTGRKIFRYRDPHSDIRRVNRGAAVLGDRVYFVTGDCHLVALNRFTGALLFSVQYADPAKGYFATVAPLAVKDKILVGVGGGDTGIRGFVAALSAQTGKELWRFWTAPMPGEFGADTWSNFNLRPLSQHHILAHWQPLARLQRRRTPRRQPLLLLRRRPRPRHRQTQMALPVHPRRHARLGCPIRSRPPRCRLPRQTPQASPAPQPQRLLLRPRPHNRRVPPRLPLRRPPQLGHRHRQGRPPPRSPQSPTHK